MTRKLLKYKWKLKHSNVKLKKNCNITNHIGEIGSCSLGLTATSLSLLAASGLIMKNIVEARSVIRNPQKFHNVVYIPLINGKRDTFG